MNWKVDCSVIFGWVFMEAIYYGDGFLLTWDPMDLHVCWNPGAATLPTVWPRLYRHPCCLLAVRQSPVGSPKGKNRCESTETTRFCHFDRSSVIVFCHFFDTFQWNSGCKNVFSEKPSDCFVQRSGPQNEPGIVGASEIVETQSR